jgi:uncharacterized surface protein with fasciclin (FAS1) repeats
MKTSMITTSFLAVAGIVALSATAHAGSCGSAKAHSHDAEPTSLQASAEPGTIVETAVSAGSFNTLVAAVQAAGLVDVLQGDGPYTVFAPTDEAFAKLPEGTVEELLKPENKDQLVAILTYHVVPGKVMSGDVVKLDEAKTVQGESVHIKTKDGKVMIDTAEVIQADVETSNGVIHVIDAVILPQGS